MNSEPHFKKHLKEDDMPYTESKVKGGYSVSSPHMVHAKHTTKAKADAQMRLLNAIEHDPNFKPRKKGFGVGKKKG